MFTEIESFLLSFFHSFLFLHYKLSVENEINNGVSIFPLSFFQALPAMYRTMQKQLSHSYPDLQLPNFLHIGGWIGGDRDGNPFVTASTLRHAFTQHADSVFHYYRTQLNDLYEDLPLSVRRVSVSNAVLTLANRSPDTDIAHEEEPYRRAIALISSRLIAKAHQLGLTLGCYWGISKDPYPDADAFIQDLETLRQSLYANGSRLLADARLSDMIRAASVFRFYLMPLDLRQHADKHAEVVAELFQHAGLENYLELGEEDRQAVLLRELKTQRPLYSPFVSYSEDCVKVLSIFQEAC